MRKEYDFSGGKRGAVLPSPGKTRTTIELDDEVIEFFRARAERDGTGYQTLINVGLRRVIEEAAGQEGETPTVRKLRQALDDENRGFGMVKSQLPSVPADFDVTALAGRRRSQGD